jgi:hypothetical protein
VEKDRIPELEDLMVEMTEEAISVRLDYETSGSNMDSGSIVAIHHNSPLLDNEKESLGDIAVNLLKEELEKPKSKPTPRRKRRK